MHIHRVVLIKMSSVALLCACLGGPAYGAELNEPISPLPLKVDLNPAKVSLGDRLFNDKQLSSDKTISCASCHDVKKGGADHLPLSKGVGDKFGPINAPTVLNSSLNFRQFWDGRAATLEEQIEGPIHAQFEMNSKWDLIISRLKDDPYYTESFNKIYYNGIQVVNIKDAIAEYERSLITPSRFDSYLRGDKNAINQDEIKGYELFKKYGCVACHQGKNVGGNMYQLFGVMGNYFKDRGNISVVDYGVYNFTQDERDRHKFKVPSLRNVAMTAPYFHDGSAQTLQDAVKIMAKYQLGRKVPESDIELIVKFLHSLSGEIPTQK